MYNKIFDEEKWKQVNQENKTIMEDFLLEYKARKMKESTLKQYKNDCRIILLFVLDNCGNRPLTELRKKDFRNLSLWLSDTLGVSNARTNRLMSCCRSMLTYVEEDDDYDYDNNLAAKVKGLPKEHVRDIVFLDDSVILELVDKLMEKKDYKKATLVALLYDCGSRKNEIAQVEKESFYDESKSLTNFLVGKRGKKYRAVYHSLTKKCVKKYLEERGEDDVKELFITEGGFPARAEVLYDWIISLRPIVEEITGKESKITVHTFRHSFIQNLSDGTHYLCREQNLGKVPLDKIKLLVNHSDISTTDSYRKDTSLEEIGELFGIDMDE